MIVGTEKSRRISATVGFSKNHHLTRHLNILVPNPDLKCSEFSQQLSCKSSLKDHIERVHQKIKMHKCKKILSREKLYKPPTKYALRGKNAKVLFVPDDIQN